MGAGTLLGCALSRPVRPNAASSALRDLLAGPIPARRRQHHLHGHGPPIHIDGRLCAAVVTPVEGGLRVISLRKANAREGKRYGNQDEA